MPEDLSGPGKGLPSARAKFEAGRRWVLWGPGVQDDGGLDDMQEAACRPVAKFEAAQVGTILIDERR